MVDSIEINGAVVKVVRGSMLDQDVDVYVNAANTSHRPGGGIDGLIHQGAGSELLKALIKVAPFGASEGAVVVTSGYKLKANTIFHVAGPKWRGGTEDEDMILSRCYYNIISTMDDMQCSTIAMPSISTGIYGYPIHLAAKIAVNIICDYLTDLSDNNIDEVIFAMFKQDEYDAFLKELNDFKNANDKFPLIKSETELNLILEALRGLKSLGWVGQLPPHEM